MSFAASVVNLCSDDEIEVQDSREPDIEITSPETTVGRPGFEEYFVRQRTEACSSSNQVLNRSWVAEERSSGASGLCHLPDFPGPEPLCRQFWKAGEYGSGFACGPNARNGQNRIRVHPKFLHSNATSHKWAFGAIAELLDNAIDEVQKGATFVRVDKMSNPRDGSPALLIQDDGGGMDPESLRCCMSFGFSDKHSDSFIGQYGNGFKASTMRLGADVIVFSCCMNGRTLTQSVGLLSYTFLRQTQIDDIIVPIVDYKVDLLTGKLGRLLRHGHEQFSCNLCTLLRWSPFATEHELLKQFNDIGHHGTKIIVFNLWLADDGDMELDFESEQEDIVVSRAPKQMGRKTLSQKHIANRLRYSFRAYASILYLHIPENFKIILRGRVVDPHHIVNDLRYCQCVKYNPQAGPSKEATVITIIGFLEGAPVLDVHGFNIYHKNRLILPFVPVLSSANSRVRGVAGVLEANFIKPTHDKQDFEKSSLYQKLETRLKDMTVEYWKYHCHLLGYSAGKHPPLRPLSSADAADQALHLHIYGEVQQVMANNNRPAPSHRLPHAGTDTIVRSISMNSGSFTADISEAAPVIGASQDTIDNTSHHPLGRMVVTGLSAPANSASQQFFTGREKGLLGKRKHENHVTATEASIEQAVSGGPANGFGRSHKLKRDGRRHLHAMRTMINENRKLREECMTYELAEKHLVCKAQKLRDELHEVQQVYINLIAEAKTMDEIKVDHLK